MPGFRDLGFVAFTTTRQAGNFSLASAEPVADVFGRWTDLVHSLRPRASRLATAVQVHGDRILRHDGTWNGWLRDTSGADGHMTRTPGTAMAVTLADCVPVFVAHPAGVGAVLHSGWKGTAARILEKALTALQAEGLDASRAVVHLGPAICGRCYEVGPEVFEAVTGQRVDGKALLDLRGTLAEQARQAGASVTISPWCTRCHNERLYSHRAGDEGRQLGVLVLPA
ncbi:MAG TPA: polyphenol oxidase family protein [Gemmatimonadaceae bacterium]